MSTKRNVCPSAASIEALRFSRAEVQRYIRRLSDVEGWLAPFSAEAIAAVSRWQLQNSIKGSVAEIGIHHGKLFFVLYLTTRADEKALAIDVFDAQQLNDPPSGKGDKRTFLEHAKRVRSDLQGIEILEESSLVLTPQRILETVGQVRLFSIDGLHTEAATMNDLRLADATLTDGGAVVLDDVFNPQWPEVSVALAKFMASDPSLVPFAITPNKVFLSRPGMSAQYASVIAGFSERLDRMGQYFGSEVAVAGIWGNTRRARLKRWLKSISRSLGFSGRAPGN